MTGFMKQWFAINRYMAAIADTFDT